MTSLRQNGDRYINFISAYERPFIEVFQGFGVSTHIDGEHTENPPHSFAPRRKPGFIAPISVTSFSFSFLLQTRDSIDSKKWTIRRFSFFFFYVDFLENGDRYVFFYFCSGLVNVSSTTLHIKKKLRKCGEHASIFTNMQLTPLKLTIFCVWHHVRSHKLALWLQFFHQISTNVHGLDQRLSSETLISFFFPRKKIMIFALLGARARVPPVT